MSGCPMCAAVSRRSVLAGGTVMAASLASGVAEARVLPRDMKALIGPGYRPTERDEIGLWQQYGRVEEEVAGSSLLLKDPALVDYLGQLIGKVGGPAARDMRIYLARIPEFNAVMFPTGFTVIFTGLLLRARNEAQLAGVIAHESGHFLRRHQIRAWRDMKRKSDILTVLAMGAGVAGGAAGVNTGDAVQLAQLGATLSLLKYSRTLEAEADAMGARLLAEAGYPPIEMANTWEQLIGESEASARYRRKRPNRGRSIFATHPAPASRMADLKLSATELTVPGKPYDNGRARYLQKIAHIRPMLLDDQVKLNDPGASQYLIETLAKDGWNGQLRFTEAEIWRLRGRMADEARAAGGYAAAVRFADAPAEAWRWHGVFELKAGRTASGRAALARYLAMKPNAPDAAYFRQLISQPEAVR